MKKLLFGLLTAAGMIFTACDSGLGNEGNGKEPFVPEISYSPQFLAFESNGGEKEVIITANFKYEVSENTDWIDIEMLETGVNVIAKENKNTYERSASIAIFNEEYDITKFIEIRQAAYIPQIELSQQSIEVGFMSGTYTINITSDCYWEATSKNDWIFVENYIGVAGTKELKFSIERNEETKNREGIIVIKNEDYNLVATLHVVQKSFPSTDHVILYTTSDGKIVTPYNETSFDANIVSNTYENGQGVMIFDAPVTLINSYAFSGERNLTNITIPNSVVTIDFESFSGCISLADIALSSNIANIGRSSFQFCTSLEKITIPDSTTYIGEKAFYGCRSLQNITIGNGLTKIGSEAFTDCSSLKDVYIKDLSAWLKIEMNSYNCNPLLNGAKLYLNGEELTELTIPSDITEIKYGAFENCISLTSVTIPNSVTKINSCAFMNCTSLTDVTIGNSLSSIGYLVFARCTSLTNIIIPDNIKSIGHYAFKECKSLTNITIPQNVTIIEEEAFMDCTSLICIYCRPITPPRGGSDMFRNNAMGRTIYVPSESVNTYKRVEWWADYDYCIEGYNF